MASSTTDKKQMCQGNSIYTKTMTIFNYTYYNHTTIIIKKHKKYLAFFYIRVINWATNWSWLCGHYITHVSYIILLEYIFLVSPKVSQ